MDDRRTIIVTGASSGLGAGVGWRDSIPGASAGRTLESIAASWATTESQLPEAVAAALRPSAQRLTELGDSIARVARAP